MADSDPRALAATALALLHLPTTHGPHMTGATYTRSVEGDALLRDLATALERALARAEAAEALLAEVAVKLPVYTIDGGGGWWRCAWCKTLSESGTVHAAECLAERIVAHRAAHTTEAET